MLDADGDRVHYAGLAAIAFAAVAVALVSQHVFDMQPCPWCIVQRMIYVVAGLIAVIAWVWPGEQGGRTHRGLSLVIALFATLGAASALWQQLVAAKSASCTTTVADVIVGMSRLDTVLPEIFQARATCAEASVALMGVPYALWSLMIFVVLATGAGRLHLEQRQRDVAADPRLDRVPV